MIFLYRGPEPQIHPVMLSVFIKEHNYELFTDTGRDEE